MDFRTLIAGLILLTLAAATSLAIAPELGAPSWQTLTQEEKQILAPLARDWGRMEDDHKKQWLGIAKRYPAMSPEEQARIQRRMQDWINLTPAQRAQARIQYKSLQTVAPEKKRAIKKKWQQYRELPEEEKQRLAEKASRTAKISGPSKPLGLVPRPIPAPAPLQFPQKTLRPAPTYSAEPAEFSRPEDPSADPASTAQPVAPTANNPPSAAE